MLLITDKHIQFKSLRNVLIDGNYQLEGVFKLKEDLYDAIKDYSPTISVIKKPDYNYDIKMEIVWDQSFNFDNNHFPSIYLIANFNPQGKEISVVLNLDNDEIESYIKLSYF